jgi:hypothetical protein
MKIQTIILGLIGITAIIYFVLAISRNQKTESNDDTERPSSEYLPTQEIQNDKIVVAENMTATEIDKILTDFCNLYNKEKYKALPRLYKLSERQFAITFPYDIEFTFFCFFINYVHYPMGFNKSFDVIGWTTTKSGENWITEKSANKKVMLFIPSDDTEYDNVYLTTEDNIGYKLGFAMGREKRLLDLTKKYFVKPKIEIVELNKQEYTDYK